LNRRLILVLLLLLSLSVVVSAAAPLSRVEPSAMGSL